MSLCVILSLTSSSLNQLSAVTDAVALDQGSELVLCPRSCPAEGVVPSRCPWHVRLAPGIMGSRFHVSRMSGMGGLLLQVARPAVGGRRPWGRSVGLGGKRRAGGSGAVLVASGRCPARCPGGHSLVFRELAVVSFQKRPRHSATAGCKHSAVQRLLCWRLSSPPPRSCHEHVLRRRKLKSNLCPGHWLLPCSQLPLWGHHLR